MPLGQVEIKVKADSDASEGKAAWPASGKGDIVRVTLSGVPATIISQTGSSVRVTAGACVRGPSFAAEPRPAEGEVKIQTLSRQVGV